MLHRKHLDHVVAHAIYQDVRRPWNHQLPSAGDAARSSFEGMRGQVVDGVEDARESECCRGPTVLGDSVARGFQPL